MKYNIYIQNNFYAVLEGDNTGDILRQVAKDISDNKTNINPNIPQNIKIEPTNE